MAGWPEMCGLADSSTHDQQWESNPRSTQLPDPTESNTIFPRIQPGSQIEPGLELNPGQLTHPN